MSEIKPKYEAPLTLEQTTEILVAMLDVLVNMQTNASYRQTYLIGDEMLTLDEIRRRLIGWDIDES